MEHTKETSVFERLLCELAGEFCGTHMLEECMKFQSDTSRKVPLRYRLIAMGFVTGCSLEELNSRLLENGCERLYPRNYWEAGLSFAFLKGLSYREWRDLQALCGPDEEETGQEPGGRGISMNDLYWYLMHHSEGASEAMTTERVTKRLERELVETGRTGKSFAEFVRSNQGDFSHVREKSRYYFCKHLYFYLNGKMEKIIRVFLNGRRPEEEVSELYLFRGSAVLKRKAMNEENMRKLLTNAPLSWGGIFNEFSAYYFDYVVTDWLEVLLECYGNFDMLSGQERSELAGILRRHDRKLRKQSDDEVLAYIDHWQYEREQKRDAIYSLDSKGRGYQKNRTGENAVRSYVAGTKDVDRTTLIAFLLFFADGARPDRERLDHILEECGFPVLRKNDPFDDFVLNYLKSRTPREYLTKTVTDYAKEEQNFYLYNTWKKSCSREQELLKIMGI